MAILARANVFLLLEMGVYEATLELLGMEMERGRGVYEGTKTNITIADNHNLRGMSCRVKLVLCDYHTRFQVYYQYM